MTPASAASPRGLRSRAGRDAPDFSTDSISRRRFLGHAAALLAVTLSGCTGTLVLFEGGPTAQSPVWRVGDRWVYRTREGFRRVDEWEESRTVRQVSNDGITLAVTREGPSLHSDRIETWAAPGVLVAGAIYDDEIRRFAAPLPRFAFPLVPGHSANLWIDNEDARTGKRGQINHFVRIGGWRSIDTPAGRFDCIAIDILMRLDDEDPWRFATECHDLFWYAPAVGQIVREERSAYYILRLRERGDGAYTTLRRVSELISYSRAQG